MPRLAAIITSLTAATAGWVCRPRLPQRVARASVLPLAPQRVLVVKLADLGDTLGIEPALASLRLAWPNASIDALVSPGARAALTTCPHLTELLDFDKRAYDRPSSALGPHRIARVLAMLCRLRARRYDLVVLLHHLSTRWGTLKFAGVARAIGAPFVAGLENGRGGFLTHAAPDLGFGARPEWRYWLDIVGVLCVEPVDRVPRYCIPATDQARADEYLASLPGGPSPLVALHAGVGGYAPIKQWPVERMATVGRHLHAEFGATLLVVGGPEMTELGEQLTTSIGAGAINLTGATSLAMLAGLLHRCRLVIGNDSGIVHLASAVGTRTLTIFGPTNPAAWAPADATIRSLAAVNGVESENSRTSASVALTRAEPCSPCHYVGFTVRARVPCWHRNCLQRLSSDSVYAVARELIAAD